MLKVLYNFEHECPNKTSVHSSFSGVLKSKNVNTSSKVQIFGYRRFTLRLLMKENYSPAASFLEQKQREKN